jgi:hypothetical protein
MHSSRAKRRASTTSGDSLRRREFFGRRGRTSATSDPLRLVPRLLRRLHKLVESALRDHELFAHGEQVGNRTADARFHVAEDKSDERSAIKWELRIEKTPAFAGVFESDWKVVRN